jgi:hypothetical protein
MARLLRYPDLKARGIVNNRMTLRRWIATVSRPACSSVLIASPGARMRSRLGLPRVSASARRRPLRCTVFPTTKAALAGAA